ncbi:hypothetical protein HYFRA_00010979 [Hymenoscyphus fraxineus]|uniref:Uncharacterized protein n=1 Tax=Hymenoscyphus fraxineus TaxID=746836 RepID=A0A9N9KZR9_9HELO|nr:hypothetical protein HYFRA_00010979 [Hymenoscyphus fraxineus]
MKSVVPVLALLFAAAQAVEMKSYVQDADVEPEFKGFLEDENAKCSSYLATHVLAITFTQGKTFANTPRFYKTTEDKKATDTYADFWTKDGTESVILGGETFPGSFFIISMKQRQLPILGSKSLLHIVNNASVVKDTPESKIYRADYILQTTNTDCSEVNGVAEFTILKTDGKPGLTPHSGSMRLYNSTISPTKTPTDVPCKKV